MRTYDFKIDVSSDPTIFDLKSFEPVPLDPSTVVNRTIDEWIWYAGTYGMGGPGFLGFRLGADWLIVAIWGAASWFRLDGRMLEDRKWEEFERPSPWQAEATVNFKELFVGRQIATLEIERDSITAIFDNGQVLKLASDPNDRPKHEGNNQARQIEFDDDLRRVVFLAPTAALII